MIVRRYTPVLIMLLREQFIKCTLYVILYVVVCFVLLKVKNRFYLTEQSDAIFKRSNEDIKKCLPIIPRPITKPVDLEIKLLQRDEMNGQSISLPESSARLQRVSQVCAKYNLRTSLVKRHFLYSPKHKSLYCWIRKVASTSFTKLFSDMTKRHTTHDYYRDVDQLAPRNLKDLQYLVNDTNTFKLLVVRHPFERLVSSYRDRIEDKSKHTAQAWIYTKKIFRLTRPELFRSNTTTGNFQQKIFTPDKRLRIAPTFKEFLQWLVQNSEEDDVHWNQYYVHCALCNIRYNYILKLDDYTYGEINYIFSKFGLDKSTVYLPKLEQTRGGYTNFHTTCKYFATLSQDLVLKLYEKYKIDFEMYNYDLYKYMFCVKNKH